MRKHQKKDAQQRMHNLTMDPKLCENATKVQSGSAEEA